MKSKLCPITHQPMRPAFRHMVLGKHEVAYYYSEESGIIQTEEPYWLEEAYQSVISKLDTWIAARNFLNQRRLASILPLLFDDRAVFVDVGCGYGLLVRLMRDVGFNFFGHDEYCRNIFSESFRPAPDVRASAICAFEVLEHLMNPHEFIAQQLQKYQATTLIASTTVFEGAIPDPSWAYYSFESGQHLTFYQPRSLAMLAHALGYRYYRLMGDLHMMTKLELSPIQRFFLTTPSARRLYAPLLRYKRRHCSHILGDYELIRKNIGQGGTGSAQAGRTESRQA